MLSQYVINWQLAIQKSTTKRSAAWWREMLSCPEDDYPDVVIDIIVLCGTACYLEVNHKVSCMMKRNGVSSWRWLPRCYYWHHCIVWDSLLSRSQPYRDQLHDEEKWCLVLKISAQMLLLTWLCGMAKSLGTGMAVACKMCTACSMSVCFIERSDNHHGHCGKRVVFDSFHLE